MNFIDEITFNPDCCADKYEIRYGLDKVEFVSKHTTDIVWADKATLVGRINRKKVGTFTVKELTEKYNKELYRKGYRSRIILTRFFSREIFNRLKPMEDTLGRPHLVEFFQDIVCKDNENVIQLTDHQIFHAYMKYSHGAVESHIYDRGKIRTYTKDKPPEYILTEAQYDEWIWKLRNAQKWLRDKDNDIIGNRTLYLGAKKDHFRFVIYARLSKQDKKSVVHSEFRLSGKEQMKRLGVLNRENGYLYAFQNEKILHAAQRYKELLKKRLKFNKINVKKVANHFLGWENRNKLEPNETKRQQLCIAHLKRLYCNYTAGFMMFAEHKKLRKGLYILR